MPNPTLLDIAKSHGSEGLAALVEEVQTYSPEVMLGATRPIVGISYKQNVRTNLPQGSFRNANEGTAASKSTWEERLFNCFIANPNRQSCDTAVVTNGPSRCRRGRRDKARLTATRAGSGVHAIGEILRSLRCSLTKLHSMHACRRTRDAAAGLGSSVAGSSF